MPVLRYRLSSRAAPGAARIDRAQFRVLRLVAESGLFTYVGNPVEFVEGTRLVAEAASFALTGQDVDLIRSKGIDAALGAFVLTGNDVALSRGFSLLAETGVFEKVGIDVSLTRPQWQLAAEAGAFNLSGQAAGLLKANRLAAETATFVLSGQDAAFHLGLAMVAEAGAYALTGNAADLRQAHVLVANVGQFLLTGNAAAVTKAYRIAAEAGGFALNGQDATLTPKQLVLIDRTAGTNIGNMTANGGLAAAFDGTTNAVHSSCAAQSVGDGWVGKTLASAKIFGRAIVYGSNNRGFVFGSNPTVTLYIRGKNGSAPSSETDGTILGTVTFTEGDDESAGRVINTTDPNNTWDHLFVHGTASPEFTYLAELVLYELA